MSAPGPTTSNVGYFEKLYRASDDPYGRSVRWYERRKRAILMASLPQPRYRHCYEPGCGTGELTVELARRCDRVLASVINGRAVDIARERVGQLASADAMPDPTGHAMASQADASATRATGAICIEQHVLPEQWPHDAGPFDLIVLSEVGYFLDERQMAGVAHACAQSLDAGGTLVACDWMPDFAQRQLSTFAVHAMLDALGLHRQVRHEESDFLMQVWTRSALSVAQAEGIRC